MELAQFHTHLLSAGLEVTPLQIADKRFCFFYLFEKQTRIVTGKIRGAYTEEGGGIELFTNLAQFSSITYSETQRKWFISFEGKFLEGELTLYD